MANKTQKEDPAVVAAGITSRRTLIGGIIGAVILVVGTIVVALINKDGEKGKGSAATYTGRVINANNEQRIRGAKVSLEVEGVPPVVYTDSEGIFSFPANDPNKEVRLRIEAKDYENFDIRVIPAKTSGIQDIRVPPKTDTRAELSGTVLDGNDKPIQGAQVTLDDIPGTAPVETSSDGVFRIKELPRKYGEGVRIRVSKEGYQPNPYTEDVVLGKAPPRIKLKRK